MDLSALRVVASLPERDLSRVRVGQTAKLISAYDDAVWTTGSVSRIAPIVDSMSGTFRVTLSLAPEQQVLRPGQFVSVELEVERLRTSLLCHGSRLFTRMAERWSIV